MRIHSFSACRLASPSGVKYAAPSIWRQRRAVDLQSARVGALDQLLVPGDQIRRARRSGSCRAMPMSLIPSMTIDVRDAGLHQHVAIESRQRADTGAVAEHAVAADARRSAPPIAGVPCARQAVAPGESGQRLFVSAVERAPSVIESPKVTTAPASLPAPPPRRATIRNHAPLRSLDRHRSLAGMIARRRHGSSSATRRCASSPARGRCRDRQADTDRRPDR